MTFKLDNPAQDQAMSEDERKFASEAIHTYQTIMLEGERMFSHFCSNRGVPETICRRLMIQIAVHRAGTNAAHELAEVMAGDMVVAAERTQLQARLGDVINRQIPLSRETVLRIGPTP